MTIDFFESNDALHVRQSFDSPTVYLDHWAMRLFSDEPVLQDRLVNALVAARGTLLLSNLSFAEFAGATDPRHCTDAEDFLERLLPHIYLTDLSLDKVLEREQREPDNRRRFWPPSDLPSLKFLVERSGLSVPHLTMRGFVMLAHERRTSVDASVEQLKLSLADELAALRTDQQYVSRARTVPVSNERPRTLLIIGELIRGFNLDPNAPIKANDITDLLHAALSLNCCDYALLDGPWSERVEKMKRRIAKTGIQMPLARCYSQRANGIDRFLSSLEVFDKTANAITSAVP